MRRHELRLRREALTALSPEQVDAVAGGLSGLTCTGWCQSDFQQCFTGHTCLPVDTDTCTSLVRTTC